MPYRCEGANLMHKKGGKWLIKQHCLSEENCHKAMALLEGLESGSIKKEDVGKGKFAKKRMSTKKFKRLTDNL